MLTAIIVAAGSSRRMGFDKLFAPLAGRPVIAHSIAAFEDCKEVEEIILVTKKERIDEMEKLIAAGKFNKLKQVIAGGVERHFSVWNGLNAVSSKSGFIAIHDGARPLTTPKLIRECLALAKQVGAACCAAQIPDTVKRASDESVVMESVERTGLWAMQTPQIFASAVIMQAYASLIANNEVVTDEVSAVQRLGKRIGLLRNDEWNFKITLPRDIELAEHVLSSRRKAEK
jgi:2-C-methyl-D-erythritol 4-phosphate cytidylyltransferase